MFEKCRTCPDFEIYEGDDGKTAYCLQGHEIGEECDAMDLESAIKHCEEVATKNLEKTMGRKADDPYAENCMRCATEHRQLAKWLKALRDIKNAMPDTLTTEYEAYVYHKLLEMEET